MRLHLSSLARDERGTSLVEFGFFVPFMAVLAMGIIDLSRGLAERFALQQAVNRSLELVQARPPVAAADATDIDFGYVRTEAASAAGVPEDNVILSRWLECSGVEQDDPAGTCPAGTDTARYLRVRISKNFEGDFYYQTIRMTATGALRTQ